MANKRDSQSQETPSGLLVIDKPVGIASTRLLYRIRGITGVRKSGHAGTLDPLAGGVLILCLGKATKLVESIMHLPKVYRATARLDVTNPGYDLEMDLETVPVESPPTLDRVIEAARALEGRIMQSPPAFSAVKRGGVPAYKLALKDKIDTLEPKLVTVYWLVVHAYDWPNLDFELACGRGTYVRSIIRDWGRALGTGGCLTSLRRTCVGPFEVEFAHTPEQVQAGALEEVLIPLSDARKMIEDGRDHAPARPA